MNCVTGSPFDAAPFGQPLKDGAGRVWEAPREIHRVVARFRQDPPPGLELQYWRSLRKPWPERRLPKDTVPGGGDVGWWELGSWYNGEWRTADTLVRADGKTVTFTFLPLDRKEFPELPDFPATFRTTLQFRLTSPDGTPSDTELSAFTDSTWEPAALTILREDGTDDGASLQAPNGQVQGVQAVAGGGRVVSLWRARNRDPNTYDRTLLTVGGRTPVTIAMDDLDAGPLWIPSAGVCLVSGRERRDYASVVSEIRIRAPRGVWESVADLPEQTWARAWAGIVPKRAPLYLPLGHEGGRHRFGLRPDGSVFYRTNDHYLRSCPGRDTPRLDPSGERCELSFGLPGPATERSIQDGVLPIGIAAWEAAGARIEQVGFATVPEGTAPGGSAPASDATGVCMLRFRFSVTATRPLRTGLRFRFSAGGKEEAISLEGADRLRAGNRVVGLVERKGSGEFVSDGEALRYLLDLKPGESHEITVRIPYLPPLSEELDRIRSLDFDAEREAVAAFWRSRLDPGMRLLVPETDLAEFHRAHAGHLLINCEREPGADRRFARVGSFSYAAFGNESCMMIADLDRRGYHREARECLQAFLHYQGTVALPGDFSSREGVLYGAGGYECGGYNQHHGWILWCLVEHYRFTRDRDWLEGIVPNLVRAADWILRERDRTRDRDDLGRGLLPHGSLEDIGDWWQWLSTNAYTWRGLDAAAWALRELRHAESGRVSSEADAYREAILGAFREASRRSPVVRLRDGTCVPHFPAHVHARGRSFGWICETLEGAIHLLITRLIEPGSVEAGWILRDYEDNLYLSDRYGYPPSDFDRHWFDRGGFSMQACLLLGVEPYLYRDEVKHALRAAFNAIAANYFADTRMLAEHALPGLGDWRGDHYKASDEANAAGWLRFLFVREDGDDLLLGQAVPREWCRPGGRVGLERAATHFGPMSLSYESDARGITARLDGPVRNPPARIRLRFRPPGDGTPRVCLVDGKPWADWTPDWVELPGDIGKTVVRIET